jgi:hypothetical protein
MDAITDAPAVFTLDEVEEAVGHVLDDWQNEWTVGEGQRRVTFRQAASGWGW